MLIKKIMLLLAVCFTNCFSIAQPAKSIGFENNYQSIPWDVEQGISVGHITSMLKDRYGFPWIGTNVALNRFEGQLVGTDSLGNNYVVNVKERMHYLH